jgi:hypothetical protein
MQSTLNPKPADDPHDVLEVAPGVVLVAPANAEEEVSSLLRAAARHHPYPKTREEPDFSAGAPIPPVDTTFRATATNNVKRRSGGGRLLRGFVGFLLAVGFGVAAAAWQAYGDTAQQMIAKVSPQRVLALLLPQDKTAPSAVDVATNAAPVQASSPAEAAVEGVAPATVAASPAASPEASPSVQSMARDLASAGQQIDQLRASIEQLKAGQEQMSRDIAKLSEAKAAESKTSEIKASEKSAEPRARLSALPQRPVAAPPRRVISSYRPSQYAAPPRVPPAQYYVPRQVEPLPPPAMAQPPVDPELASVPRPPMPLRE